MTDKHIQQRVIDLEYALSMVLGSGMLMNHYQDELSWRGYLAEEDFNKYRELLSVGQLSIGDKVIPIDPNNVLASGCGRYPFAVVVQLDPLILVSEATDMKWSCDMHVEDYMKIGTVSHNVLNQCKKRLVR